MLSESGYNSSVYLKTATDALEYIDNYAPSKSKTADGEYCYTLGCYIKSRALKGEVKLSYNNSGDNKASLVRDFVWVDAITNEQILLKNNSLLLTSTDIKKIERRKNNVKKLCDNTIVYEDGSVEVEGTQSGGDSNNNGSNNSNTKVIKYLAMKQFNFDTVNYKDITKFLCNQSLYIGLTRLIMNGQVKLDSIYNIMSLDNKIDSKDYSTSTKEKLLLGYFKTEPSSNAYIINDSMIMEDNYDYTYLYSNIYSNINKKQSRRKKSF